MRPRKFHYICVLSLLLFLSSSINALPTLTDFTTDFTVGNEVSTPENCKWHWLRRFYGDVERDYLTYYSKDNLLNLGGVFVAAGIMANTNIDYNLHRFWQNNIRQQVFSDNFFKFPNTVGKFSYFRVYIGTMVLGSFREYAPGSQLIYEWGYRALRTMLLISPQEVFISWALGNGRPSDKHHPYSKWQFFGKGGNAGCSGHAFNGAVPFITAAMMTEDPKLRFGLYAVSFLPGLARINKGNHYFSQYILGWAIAYLSAKAVDNSGGFFSDTVNVSIQPVHEGAMLRARMQF